MHSYFIVKYCHCLLKSQIHKVIFLFYVITINELCYESYMLPIYFGWFGIRRLWSLFLSSEYFLWCRWRSHIEYGTYWSHQAMWECVEHYRHTSPQNVYTYTITDDTRYPSLVYNFQSAFTDDHIFYGKKPKVTLRAKSSP